MTATTSRSASGAISAAEYNEIDSRLQKCANSGNSVRRRRIPQNSMHNLYGVKSGSDEFLFPSRPIRSATPILRDVLQPHASA